MLVSLTSHALTSQGHGSMKAVAALLLVGMLILWAELPTGRRCPRIRYGEEKLRCWEGATFTWILWEGEREERGVCRATSPQGPSNALEQTSPSSCRQRLVLPPRHHHLRAAQPAEPVPRRLALPPRQEVLPVLLRKEVPLQAVSRPHLLR